jgi:hypothetical protein
VARGLPAVNASVKEDETLEDVNVVMEIFGVHDEYVLPFGDIKAPWLGAVVVEFSRVDAHLIGTLGALLENVESLLHVTLELKEKISYQILKKK